MQPAEAQNPEPEPPSARQPIDAQLERARAEDQLRSIRDALRAARQGDFAVRLPVDGGIAAEVALELNGLLGRNEALIGELDRVARPGGQTAERVSLGGVSGGWGIAVESVNSLIDGMERPIAEATRVLCAVADGDLSQAMRPDPGRATLRGESLMLGSAVNTVVDRLRTVSTGIRHVVREIGVEGKLGAYAEVDGLSGTWKDLLGDVNLLAGNLSARVRNIVLVAVAIANGDLSQTVTVETKGEILELKNTINAMVDQLRTFASEVTRVAREVGTAGKLGGQAVVPGVAGTWRDLTDGVNMLAGNLTAQVRNIALVTTAVANGDLSRKITVEAKGEIRELKDTINAMVDRLRTLAAEVTRVAREVGTEGQLGGQGEVPGVSGTWKDLTDNVNLMAGNLTDQVRGISKVVTAVANGDLSKKLMLVAKGEIAALADTINNMTDTLRTFAEQVTTVAREVGIEGKLGGQAKVPGAAGTWRDLTDNVNKLASNLTTQVRAISDVAAAVIQGDLSRTIKVEARGEVLGLKDTINQMIANLRDTTRTNNEQDWLKTNLARFFGMMQGQRSLESLAQLIMSELTPLVGAQHGAFYLMEATDPATLKLISTYAYSERKRLANRFSLGESLVGQCALERKPILVGEMPDDYIRIGSGLGEASPRNVAVIPVLFESQVKGVIEVASFHEFTPVQLTFLEQLMLNIGVAINLIGASMRTEELLQQLQRSNVELEKRRSELEEKARLLEIRTRDVANASASLEEKAKELARVSQYKSQFLANMSHEIRTPLNSMMILAQMLAANEEKNLLEKQREYAETIYAAGRDLLALINQILDLAKIEAGRIDVHVEKLPLSDIAEFAERMFRPTALQNGLEFSVAIAPDLPATVTTDRRMTEQILKNLLANAFKFTERGRVDLRLDRAPAAEIKSAALRAAPAVLAFTVSDTGIGIPVDKQAIIFEAFQQADPSITRKYGGTGLGLTISREFARVLGGEIAVKSADGVGSTLTLRLPLQQEDLVLPKPAPSGLPQPVLHAAPPSPAAIDPQNRAALANRKVLVVEDDARNLYAVTSLLEGYGVVVIPTTSAREAFSELRAHPDIGAVLMDVMLPEIDGLQATREIRRMPEFAALPIVALTAKASESDRAACLEAGCNEYVSKPVETRSLVAVLRRFLEGARAA